MERRDFVSGFAAGLGALYAVRSSWASQGTLQMLVSGWDGMLAPGQFIPAKMPLSAARVVLPRPDAETSTRAYHRNAHISLPYELPIVVQGGAWPFVYELVSAPAGAVLGRNYGDADYGILRWAPTQNGPFAFTVRVRDQDGASVQFSWSGVVGSDWVRFVDAVNGSDTSGTGALSQPWRSLAHAYANTADGRALCLRAGTYQSLPNAAMSIATNKIASLIGWPGELPVIDCTTQSAQSEMFAWYNSSDTFVSHIRMFGGSTTAANPRYFSSLNVNHRCYQYRIFFDSPLPGTAPDDNNSCLFLGNGGGQRLYVAQVHCTFQNLPYNRNGFSGIDTYATRYMVVADNTFTSGDPRDAVLIKGGRQEDISVRGNRWPQAWDGASLVNIYMAVNPDLPEFRNIEVCYNTVASTGVNRAITLGGADQVGPRGPIWVYRNTVRGLVVIDSRDWPLQISFENDVIVHDAEVFGGSTTSAKVMMVDANDPADRYRDPATRPNITLSVVGTECHRRSSDAVLDTNFRLQGTWRGQYLGTHGAEIVTPGSLFADGFESA